MEIPMSTMELDLIASDLPDEQTGDVPTMGSAETVAHRFPTARINGVVTGTLIGFRDEGCTPLVLWPGQSAAVAGATIIDVHGAHVGRQVAVMFENGDPQRPMIMGLLRTAAAWPLAEQPGQAEVTEDGERLIVTAKDQLVLRCGKASITLTKAGKVLIEGAYVSNRSSGVMRIKGGSVNIN
jgi:uncharacterized protein DUF6484